MHVDAVLRVDDDLPQNFIGEQETQAKAPFGDASQLRRDELVTPDQSLEIDWLIGVKEKLKVNTRVQSRPVGGEDEGTDW